jgi:hypothetical protein
MLPLSFIFFTDPAADRTGRITLGRTRHQAVKAVTLAHLAEKARFYHRDDRRRGKIP